jgi:tellurium resistance protein TerD
MGVSLSKGGNVSLSKERRAHLRARRLGWDTRVTDGSAFDLDASAFVLGAEGRSARTPTSSSTTTRPGPAARSSTRAINTTGEAPGDDEVVMVHLTKLPADAPRSASPVTIHDAESRRQNFGMVTNAFIRVVTTRAAPRSPASTCRRTRPPRRR